MHDGIDCKKNKEKLIELSITINTLIYAHAILLVVKLSIYLLIVDILCFL